LLVPLICPLVRPAVPLGVRRPRVREWRRAERSARARDPCHRPPSGRRH